jgi:preprotein translocase SecE subunit
MANGVAAKGPAKPKTDSLFVRGGRFLKEAWTEVRYKATWPSWTELKRFTAVVIMAVVIVGVWIGGLDWILTQVTHLIERPIAR